MANTIPSGKEMATRAREIAAKVKNLQSKITTASGAVVGGPGSPPPPVQPTPPGNG